MISNKQLGKVLDAFVKKDGTYYTYIYCSNCGKQEFTITPKGTTIEQFKEINTCSNCECRISEGK